MHRAGIYSAVNHFNPRLPGGRRLAAVTLLSACSLFQSTPPGWEATLALTAFSVLGLFQSTPPGWEATYNRRRSVQARHYFNPRLPGGRRRYDAFTSGSPSPFQSTPPGWEATDISQTATLTMWISIHASRVGGDPPAFQAVNRQPQISIHASRVGGDLRTFYNYNFASLISIHASRVGGDNCRAYCKRHNLISIHASRVGGDGRQG